MFLWWAIYQLLKNMLCSPMIDQSFIMTLFVSAKSCLWRQMWRLWRKLCLNEHTLTVTLTMRRWLWLWGGDYDYANPSRAAAPPIGRLPRCKAARRRPLSPTTEICTHFRGQSGATQKNWWTGYLSKQLKKHISRAQKTQLSTSGTTGWKEIDSKMKEFIW